MKRIFLTIGVRRYFVASALGVFVYLFIGLLQASSAYAQSITPIQGNVTVKANVGNYFLSLSGYIAPFASITLIINDTVIKSTTADSNGNFSFSNIPIIKGLTTFCFDSIDVKRYGESYTCMKIPPASGNVTLTNIFLPPTIGLEQGQITQGQDAVARGYSMPSDTVTITINGKTYTVTTDPNGYYELHLKQLTPGSYQLVADATYKGKKSLQPQKSATLLVLSLVTSIGQTIQNVVNQFLVGNPWIFFLITLPLLLLILLLLGRLKPGWFTWIEEGKDELWAHVPWTSKKLHHAWWIGY